MNRNRFCYSHKICDPIHGFIRFDDEEKKVIDSRPFQRLRYIHQMGIAYLIYPGASHKRFEHSLGVMELASRIYDSITNEPTLDIIPKTDEEFHYWRRLIRIAALCHDLGHLPFSHTAEEDLIPGGKHERMTLRIIQSSEMRAIWKTLPSMGKNVEEDIVKLVLSEKQLREFCPHITLSRWEKVLSQTITDDNFGADRVDYLIRDAYYTGVGYGHFDYHQLIDSLRIVFNERNNDISIGVLKSGLESIESLWIARYLMYSRVYYHSKSRVYSKHLARFMKNYFCEKGFPTRLEEYLYWTDYEILSKIAQASEDPTSSGHHDALCLMNREKIYQEIEIPSNLYEISQIKIHLYELRSLFMEFMFVDQLPVLDKEKLRYFSVLTTYGNVSSSIEESIFLRDIPISSRELTFFVAPSKKEEILNWLNRFKKI